MQRLHLSPKGNTRTSDLLIGRGLRRNLDQYIAESKVLAPRRLLIVSNKQVFGLYGQDVTSTLGNTEIEIFEWLMPEGERFKSFRSLEKLVEFLGNNGFERNDLIVALGGGVVGDLAGFAAAIYLRGIPFIQVPTTLLSQVDSSVGGKTGINLPVGKNLVGAFYQPPLVVIDLETLQSLPRREMVSGFCEMLKHSLIASPKLFASTVRALKNVNEDAGFVLTNSFESLVKANCSFKASIVANDERESIKRSDAKSRKILNFGHTSAHALEAVTNYRVFRHGEAVGYGMLVAGELSRNLGLLDSMELESLREAVHLCGSLPPADELDLDQIINALQHDKKSVGGQLSWVLLNGIGKPQIVPGQQVSAKLLRLSLRTGLRSFGRRKDKSH